MSKSPAAPANLTTGGAWAVLGLDGPCSPEVAKAAFKEAVKASRPDQGQGDEDRFRRVIEAYRLIQRLQTARAVLSKTPTEPDPPADPVLEIGVAEAMLGLGRRVRIGGRSISGVKLPAGLRNDDRVRLKGRGMAGEDLIARIHILAEPNRAVVGDDLWLSVPVAAEILSQGGRIAFEAPGGGGWATVPRGFPSDGRLRLKGQGLPARGARLAGDLLLQPDPDAEMEPVRVWTRRAKADRRAAR